jgi:hypothetical protein
MTAHVKRDPVPGSVAARGVNAIIGASALPKREGEKNVRMVTTAKIIPVVTIILSSGK